MKNLYLLFLSALLVNFGVVDHPSIYAQSVVMQPKSYYRFTYKTFWQMYEVHADYVKITTFNEIVVKREGELIDKGSPSLYEAKDAYDITTSDNVKVVGRSEEIDRWRGVNYNRVKLELKPDHRLKEGEPFTFWRSFKVKRLPHLHSITPIRLGIEHHLGINVKPYPMDRHYDIVALPASTEIHSVFNFLPTKEIKTEEWIFLIYDITGRKNNISLHVKFTLTSDSPRVKIQDINAMLKEMN